MKVGILGSASVAKALGEGFLKYNHEVMLSSRSPDSLKEWQQAHASAKIGSFEQAASFGDIIVLAVKGIAAKSVVESVADKLKGKTVIDTTNPIADSPPQDGVISFFTTKESLMEQLQQAVDAKFVKAFNSIGAAHMVNPQFESTPTMFICGNDENAKKQVSEIIERFGFDVADMGSARAARAIEPLCILWCIPGFLKGDWSHAFKLLK